MLSRACPMAIYGDHVSFHQSARARKDHVGTYVLSSNTLYFVHKKEKICVLHHTHIYQHFYLFTIYSM